MVMQEIKNSVLCCKYSHHKGYIFIDYLEVYEEFRNQNYGSKFLKEFIEYFKSDIKIWVLEESLLGFYEPLGFKVVNIHNGCFFLERKYIKGGN